MESEGCIECHKKTRELEENDVYPYLMGNARARLAQARHVAANAGITGRNHGSIDNETARNNNALEAIKKKGANGK